MIQPHPVNTDSTPSLLPHPAGDRGEFPGCDRLLQGMTQALTLLLTEPDVSQGIPLALAYVGMAWGADCLRLEPLPAQPPPRPSWLQELALGEDPDSLDLLDGPGELAYGWNGGQGWCWLAPGSAAPSDPAPSCPPRVGPTLPSPWLTSLGIGRVHHQTAAAAPCPWLQERGLAQVVLCPVGQMDDPQGLKGLLIWEYRLHHPAQPLPQWSPEELALARRFAWALGGAIDRDYQAQTLARAVKARTRELWQTIEELESRAVEHEETESQLQSNYNLLSSVINGTSDLIFVKDIQGYYVLVNQAALDFWQVSLGAVLGQDEYAIFSPDEARRLRDIDREVIEKKYSETIEETLTLRGKSYTFLTTKTPYFDNRGQVAGLIGITRDITHRKDAEETLRKKTQELQQTLDTLQKTQSHLIHSEKMSSLGQLVAGVAHEINNPVNFIYGNTRPAENYITSLLGLIKLYQQHFPAPPGAIRAEIESMDLDFIMEDLPNILRSIRLGAERIQEIVKSLRNFSRMNESSVKVVDIHEGIDSTLMILRPRLKAQIHREAVDLMKYYGDLPLVECYAGQLNQVLMNLLTNALDSLDDRSEAQANFVPQITITTQAVGDFIEIAIMDNGTGIPEGIQPRLFDPFFTTKPVGKGTGMGLSISYQIITELHRGTLRCESQLGRGTTFTIVIPLHQKSNAAQNA